MGVTVDTLPILVAALGVGLGLADQIVRRRKDTATTAQEKQIETLQKLLEAKDEDREHIRIKRMELEAANEELRVRIARLEAESRG